MADELPETRHEAGPESDAETDAIRSELGIGGMPAIDQQEIDKLLRAAEVDYEELFSEIEAEPGTRNLEPDGSFDPSLELLRDVHLKVKVELGRGRMCLQDILRLREGSVVELGRLAGDPLDIYVNDMLVARGQFLVLNENFCIRITEVFNPAEAVMR